MPWCPNCGKEYREGLTVCIDCGGQLVEGEGAPTPRSAGAVYQDSLERASENRSSAWVLLILGSLGILGIALGITGVIPLKFGNSYLLYGVMSAIFILFLVSGIVSMKNARIFEKKAESENSIRDIMLEWCKGNLGGKELDEQIGVEAGDSEEILYFKRFEYIKEKLNYQFVNLDQNFLERFIDDCVYDMVFHGDEEEE